MNARRVIAREVVEVMVDVIWRVIADAHDPRHRFVRFGNDPLPQAAAEPRAALADQDGVASGHR